MLGALQAIALVLATKVAKYVAINGSRILLRQGERLWKLAYPKALELVKEWADKTDIDDWARHIGVTEALKAYVQGHKKRPKEIRQGDLQYIVLNAHAALFDDDRVPSGERATDGEDRDSEDEGKGSN